MLGIRQNIGESKNQQNVRPPRKFVQKMKVCNASEKKRIQFCTDGESTVIIGWMHSHIREIYSGKRNHQKKDNGQGNQRINLGFWLHFNTIETLDRHENAPENKNQDGHHNDISHNIARSHHKMIKPAGGRHTPIHTGNAINHHFDAAQGNHHKTPKYQRMNQPNHRKLKNFGLTDRHFHHNTKALPPIGNGKRFG